MFMIPKIFCFVNCTFLILRLYYKNDVKVLDLYSTLADDEEETWLVQTAPSMANNPNGVLIQTQSTHRFLFLQRQGKNSTKLKTIEHFCGAPCTWQLDSANQKNFFIYSIGRDRRIGATMGDKAAVTTTTKKKSDV